MSGNCVNDHRFDPILVVGLMSGTSADGVDAALVKTDGASCYEYCDAVTVPYESDLRSRLLEVAQSDIPLQELLRLERRLTDVHAQACRELISQTSYRLDEVQLIGFHGHTIRHNAQEHFTWQLGDASYLSESTKCTVVSDFRRRDLAAGGRGAVALRAAGHDPRVADR